jgi:hypothetical protein
LPAWIEKLSFGAILTNSAGSGPKKVLLAVLARPAEHQRVGVDEGQVLPLRGDIAQAS